MAGPPPDASPNCLDRVALPEASAASSGVTELLPYTYPGALHQQPSEQTTMRSLQVLNAFLRRFLVLSAEMYMQAGGRGAGAGGTWAAAVQAVHGQPAAGQQRPPGGAARG